MVRKACVWLQVSTEGPRDTAHPGSKFLLWLLEEEDERKDSAAEDSAEEA